MELIVAQPMPYSEALAIAQGRGLLPTSLNSAELAQFPAAVLRRSTFSATVEAVRVLEGIAAGVQAVLTGEASQREVRDQLLALHDLLGTPSGPGLPGTVGDVPSQARADLQIRTLVETAQGLGWHTEGMQPDVLDAYPAQELRRFMQARYKVRDWPTRWALAGGRFYGRRMIALKTDPVWARLGDRTLFADALGNPYPPFAFNSGMDVQDIDRAEAEALGLLAPGEKLLPAPADAVAGGQLLGPTITQNWLRDIITEAGLGTVDAEGVLRSGKLVARGGAA
jgi:hypothetical protein